MTHSSEKMTKSAKVILMVAVAVSAVACSGSGAEVREDRTGAARSVSPAAPVVAVAPEVVPKPVINLDEPRAPRGTPARSTAPRNTASRPLEAGVKEAGPISIKRLVVSRGVENREPIEAADTFSIQDGTRLFAFVEVDNPSHDETELTVSFEGPDGRSRGPVPLRVGASPRWRTWAQTRFADVPGTWTVSVRDAQGKLLCQTMFEMSNSWVGCDAQRREVHDRHALEC